MRDPNIGGADLVQSTGPKHKDFVYLRMMGRRHWVMDGAVLGAYGLDFSQHLKQVSDEAIDSLRPGQTVPKVWTSSEIESPPLAAGKGAMRQMVGARVSGMGVEIGALAAPFPVPLACATLYADVLNHEEIKKANPDQPERFLVVPMLKTTFETLAGLNDESLDYVVAAHVIEHTRDPIGAITNSFKKLRLGGSLLLVCPDQERTWDRLRSTTSLDHLIADYLDPSRERDKEDYQQYMNCFYHDQPELRAVASENAWVSNANIHHHAWRYDTFGAMVDWIVANSAPYGSVWSASARIDDGDSDEFYFVLTK